LNFCQKKKEKKKDMLEFGMS